MKLLELYALSSGLKIGKQFVLERFFPLPFSKYITLHASSSQNAAKNYPYYAEVIGLVKPYLDAQGINIVQMGTKDDIPIQGCYHTMGRYGDFGKGSYIVRHSLLHVGNDSVWAHRAGYLGIPLVQPWGPTDPRNHSSLEATNKRFLESHRWGRKATFVAQENPLSIALVDPFDMARAILDILKIEHTITQRSQYVGPMFGAPLLEIIPNTPVAPNFNPEVTTAIRMDLDHNEDVLGQILQTRKVNVVTKKPINPQLLMAFKANILTYSHEVDKDCPIDYLKQVSKIIPKVTFFSRTKDEKELAELRLQFLDVVKIEQVIEKTREDFEIAAKEYLNDKSFSLDSDGKLGKLMFKAQKYVLSKGKIYLSLAHERADKPMDGSSTVTSVIDSPDLWRDFLHYLFYVN